MEPVTELKGLILGEDAKHQIPHDWDGEEIFITDGYRDATVYLCGYCDCEGSWYDTKEEAVNCCQDLQNDKVKP